MSEKQRSHREKGLMSEHLLIQLTRGHFQWPLIVGRDPDPSSVVSGFPDVVRDTHSILWQNEPTWTEKWELWVTFSYWIRKCKINCHLSLKSWGSNQVCLLLTVFESSPSVASYIISRVYSCVWKGGARRKRTMTFWLEVNLQFLKMWLIISLFLKIFRQGRRLGEHSGN